MKSCASTSTSTSSSTCGFTETSDQSPDNTKKNEIAPVFEERQDNDAGASKNQNQNPLEMVDIVCHLLKKLDGSTLKTALMVSKLWNENGMRLFIKHHFVRIPPKFACKKEEMELLRKMKSVFSFSKFPKIPNAVLYFPRDIEILSDLKILRQLEHVKIEALGVGGAGDLPFDTNNMEPLMKSVLKTGVCPELKLLEHHDSDLDYSFMRLCVEGGKKAPLAVSNFRYHVDDHTELDLYTRFAQSGVGVVNLSLLLIHHHDAGFNLSRISAMEKLLNSSKTALKILTLSSPDPVSSFASFGNVPVMESLEELNMIIRPRRRRRRGRGPENPTVLFPAGFRFSQNCPNLDNFWLLVELEKGQDGRGSDPAPGFLDQPFATCGTAPSVKTLQVYFTHRPLQFDKLLSVFPGIHRLEMNYFPETCFNSIWLLCPQVKSLCLFQNYFDREEDADADSRDCELLGKLCGYSLDFIETVWKFPDELDLEVLEKETPPRTRPSILNLQYLETLTILGREDSTRNSKLEKLAQRLAFNSMPNLKSIRFQDSSQDPRRLGIF